MHLYKKYLKKYSFLFFTAVVFVTCEAVCDLLQPTILARVIDEGVKGKNTNIIFQLLLTMLLVTALGACFAAARNIIAGKVSQSFGADLREDVFEKIMHFSEESADRMESGSLITRMTSDTSQVTLFINGLMRIFFKAPVTCIGSIVLALVLSVRLSIVLFTAVAIITAMIVVSMKMSYVRFARVQVAVDRVNTTVQEFLSGIRLVKAFGRQKDEMEKFDRKSTDLADRSVSSQLVIAWFSPLMSLTINLGIAAIIYTGSLLFARGNIEVGRITAFTTYMTQILGSLIMITNVFNTFVRTRASTERLREVLQSPEDFSRKEGALPVENGALCFENVSFSYPQGSGVPALQNLSFTACPGETLAIIGPTGSGKTTVAFLSLRFYDADEGAISLGGTNIKHNDPEELRRHIALAPQKSLLFSGTVFDNIVYGKPDASLEDAEAAAHMAEADGFIRLMPESYQSIIGQGGVNLSGGQRQRISIARALAKNAPVLILDDCTGALDAVTEARVRRSLRTAGQGKAVILITQKVTTAMTADRILVLDNGMCAGYDCHPRLLESCRIYREIYDSQIGGEKEAKEIG